MSPKTGEKSLDYYMGLPYKVEISHDEDGWFAKVFDLPGCMTWADTFVELGPMIEDAKRGWIEDALEYGDPVPEPRATNDFSGKVNLRMPKSLHRDLARQAEDDGVSLNQLMVSHLARGAGGVPPASKAVETPAREDEADVQQEERAKQGEVLRADQILSRDWPQEVQRALQEYEELLGEEDITPLASSRIVTDSSNLLVEFSNELTAISDRVVQIGDKLTADTKKRRYKPRRLKELEKAFANLTETFHALRVDFEKLEAFCTRAIAEYKRRFGDEPDQEPFEDSDLDDRGAVENTDLDAYSAVREAEAILEQVRSKAGHFDE